MRISIFGIGYVGAVSAACLAEFGHVVTGIDLSREKTEALSKGQTPVVEARLDELISTNVRRSRLLATMDAESAVADSEISFIAVGTPSLADGSASLTAVTSVLESIGGAIRKKNGSHVVVMRSTVPPGTGDQLAIPLLEKTSGRQLGDGLHYYSNPEFLREGSAISDFQSPPFTLIGTPETDDGAAQLRSLYKAIEAPVHVVPLRVAETVKLISNVYHAVKLSFANEAGGVLAAAGVDPREVFRIFCEDRTLNISAAYLRPGFAFGGSCLPKDVRSFLHILEQTARAAPMLGAVLDSNASVIERAFQMIGRHGRRPVAQIGLAFKQGTDDLRESPYVTLAERLIGRGYDLRVFDRSVNLARLIGANKAYIEREVPHIERLLAPDIETALQTAEIVVIGHVAESDHPALMAGLDGKIVIDLAGYPNLSSHPGIRYEGFCW